MGKSKKSRAKDKRSSAYYDDYASKKTKHGSKKSKCNNSNKYEREFTDWESL